MEIRIYVANLAQYVAGRLVGEWVDLPCDDLDDVLARISHDGRDELAIHDYEAPFKIEEYSNIHQLNELAEELADIDEDDDVIAAIMGNWVDDKDGLQCLKDQEYRVYWDCDDMSDVAYEYVEETGMLHDIPDHLQNYFDYEKYGRDMEIEGTFIRGYSEAQHRSFYVEIIG